MARKAVRRSRQTPRASGAETRRQKVQGDNAYLSTLESWRRAIKAGMELEGLSISKLAATAGIAPATVSKFLDGKTLDPRSYSVFKMAQAVWLIMDLSTEAEKPKRPRRTTSRKPSAKNAKRKAPATLRRKKS